MRSSVTRAYGARSNVAGSKTTAPKKTLAYLAHFDKLWRNRCVLSAAHDLPHCKTMRPMSPFLSEKKGFDMVHIFSCFSSFFAAVLSPVVSMIKTSS